MIEFKNYDLIKDETILFTDKIRFTFLGTYQKSNFGLKNNEKILLRMDYQYIGTIEDNGHRVVIDKNGASVVDENFKVIFSSKYSWISKEDKNGHRRYATKNTFGILDKNFNVIYQRKEKTGWLGIKDTDNNRVVVSTRNKFFIGNLIPSSALTIILSESKRSLNALGKSSKNNDLYKYKLSKEYLTGVRNGEIIPYFNFFDQTEKLEGDYMAMYDSIKFEYINKSEKFSYNLLNENGVKIFDNDFDLISNVLEGKRYLFRKKKIYQYNIDDSTLTQITNEQLK